MVNCSSEPDKALASDRHAGTVVPTAASVCVAAPFRACLETIDHVR